MAKELKIFRTALRCGLFHKIGCLLFLLLLCIAAEAAATIDQIRVSKSLAQTRVVLDSVQPIQAKLVSLQQPDRLIVDIADAKLKATIDINALFGTSIKNIRSHEDSHDHLRLVFDLTGPQKVDHFMLNPSSSTDQTANKLQWHRLVIDLKNPAVVSDNKPAVTLPLQPIANNKQSVQPSSSDTSSKYTIVPSKVPKLSVQLETKKAPLLSFTEAKQALSVVPTTQANDVISSPVSSSMIVPASLKPKLALSTMTGKRKVVVVLDAGHGGHDSGAVGPSGVFEKDVVLKMTHALAAVINRHPGMQAVLTRDDDYFIPLRERLRLARKGKADMFIAIHADAYKLPQSSGASVFALSGKGASSEAARWLAEKENYSELGGASIKDKNPLLFSVLLDLSQTGTIRESLKLGEDILQELRQITKLHHNYVEQAPFMVLKSPDIPSLLIETGFISNPEEEQKLSDAGYHAQLAEAIVKGIRRYFELNPPPNSFFARAKNASSS